MSVGLHHVHVLTSGERPSEAATLAAVFASPGARLRRFSIMFGDGCETSIEYAGSVLRNFARRRGDTERSFRFGLPEGHAADANENM
jgi:hypothetical protein